MTTYGPPNLPEEHPPIAPKKRKHDLAASERVLALTRYGDFIVAWVGQYRGKWNWYTHVDYDFESGPVKTSDVIAWWPLPAVDKPFPQTF